MALTSETTAGQIEVRARRLVRLLDRSEAFAAVEGGLEALSDLLVEGDELPADDMDLLQIDARGVRVERDVVRIDERELPESHRRRLVSVAALVRWSLQGSREDVNGLAQARWALRELWESLQRVADDEPAPSDPDTHAVLLTIVNAAMEALRPRVLAGSVPEASPVGLLLLDGVLETRLPVTLGRLAAGASPAARATAVDWLLDRGLAAKLPLGDEVAIRATPAFVEVAATFRHYVGMRSAVGEPEELDR